MISLNIEKTFGFISKASVAAYEAQVKAAQEALENGTGKGNDFLGWLHLPSSISQEHLADLKATAQVLRDNCEVVIVAGIGGSYLGARAVIEALSNSFTWLQEKKTAPVMIYAGHNISEDYLYELTEFLKDKKFGVINISKSGTTTETALAFRLLKKQCEDQRGKEMAKKVIVAITDAKKGAARITADKEGYKSFIIPDNVGGRFSVLTPVGLLPIAIAGFDIEKLVAGAADMEKACGVNVPFAENLAAQYAATRNELYKNGKKIEILVNFCPKLHYVSEWWKQLYGESEGKENKGIFPAAVDFSTDLHSMGQYVQDGKRILFETVINVEQARKDIIIESDEAITKVYKAKERSFKSPLIVLVSDVSKIEEIAYIEEKNREKIEKLIKKFWPGGLTIIRMMVITTSRTVHGGDGARVYPYTLLTPNKGRMKT